MLRHGHTAWNREGRIQGRVDEPLDEQARAHLSAHALPAEFEDNRIISSPLRRAAETARLLTLREPELAPQLLEMDWGLWEGRRGLDLLADVQSGYRHIEEWGWDFQPPGGETPAAVRTRLRPWLAGLSGSVVAVSHIGIMRVLLAMATGWDFRGEPPFKVKRDRLYVLNLHTGGALSHDGTIVRLTPRTSP